MDAKQALFLITLKRIKRTGWVRSKIPYPESVAAHSWGSAALAVLLARHFEGVDREKLVRMVIFHDIGEAGTGVDFVADRWGEINWKKRKDKATQELKRIFGRVPKEVFSLFKEMEAGKTPEAQAAKEIEKLDMALTAFLYEKETGKNLQEFYDSAIVWIKNPALKRIFNSIVGERKLILRP